MIIHSAGVGTPAFRVPLEATDWKPIKASKPQLGCKYAGDVVRSLQLKRGKLLKLAAQADDLGIPIATDPRPIRIEVAHGTVRHCFEFGGGRASHKPGKKLLVTDAAPASVCP